MKPPATPNPLERPLASLKPLPVLSPAGKKVLSGDGTVRGALDRLIEQGSSADAIALLAAALPTRLAVWWACLCAQLAADPATQSPENLASLSEITRWVVKPEARKLAPAALACQPAARIARALPAEREPTPANVSVAHRSIAVAIIGVAAECGGLAAIRAQQRFVAIGMHIAAGKLLWTR